MFIHSKKSLMYEKLSTAKEKNDFFQQIISNYKLSASHILKYKSCSKSFLYENFLKVKYPPNDAMLKGTIVHSVLDWIFKYQKENLLFPSINEVEIQFEKIKNKEEKKNNVFLKDEEIKIVKEIVVNYFLNFNDKWNTIAITEFYVLKHIWNSIPLTGFIDKIEFNGRNINIVDYKTGNLERAILNFENGGSYWFQLVFYSVLLQEYKPNWTTESIELCILSDQIRNIKVKVSEKDKALVKKQIVSVYEDISSYKFDGCRKKECYWCSEYKV